MPYVNPRGGVKLLTIVDCPQCGEKVAVGAGYVMRLPGPNRQVKYCHEIIDPDNMVDGPLGPEPFVVKRGGLR